MKFDRRTFLTLGLGAVAGGAVGINFTPVPWKLTDDVSIWTQNWPWTPVPQTGETSYKQTTCTLCPGGCGVSVRKVGKRCVKIEGTEGHPVNNGGVCLLGNSGLQYLYGPDRVRGPMKRAGRRGEGRFIEITWEEAISEVAEKLAKIRAAGKPHTVACMTGAQQDTVSALFARFLEAYGSPNLFKSPTAWDTQRLSARLMCGLDAAVGYDLDNADYILSFGSGLIDGWGSPVHHLANYGAWHDPDTKEKAYLVQAEPRLSLTAAKADAWVAVNPGAEGPLALAMVHVIIADGLYDKNFVNSYTTRFEDWTDPDGRQQAGFKRTVLENYSPDKLAKITGVAPERVRKIAREFARARKPVAICGTAQGDQAAALYHVMAVQALNALAGNINRPGGMQILEAEGPFPWPDVQKDAKAEKGLEKPRLDAPAAKPYPLADGLIHAFAGAVLAQKPYPVEALLVAGGDPAYFLPRASEAKKALSAIPLVVSFSPVFNDTAMYADYILPDDLYLESVRDVPSPPGLVPRVVGLTRAVTDPVYASRPAGDSLIAIAKAMGGTVAGSFAWKNYQAALKQAMGGKWRTLSSKGYWIDESPAPSWTQLFGGKRFSFCPTPPAGGRTGMKPQPLVVDIPGDAKSMPLLAVPVKSMQLENGQMAATPFMMKTIPDTVLDKADVLVVEVNPQTAGKLGIGNRKAARLATPFGEADVLVVHNEGVMPGLVGLPCGFGHAGYSRFVRGKGANYHALSGAVADPLTGHDVAWGVRARLTQA
ncbi:MAG: molybdopterin-dependent oxidoreductase [Deltaproteobacteria bacterium]|nr:molybdopterin-dependent oxidoreductase [Deltaproteobacteria bacterium]